MEKHIFTTNLFYKYVNSRNTSIFDHKGYYIQERNNFFIAIDSQYYEKFKTSLINRRADIIAEQHKTINKQHKTERNFLYITCKYACYRKSVKALFKKYALTMRKKRVLDPNYHEQRKREYYELKSRNNAKISPKKSDN